MKYTNLGKSDLKVSRICMGCMGFGNAATGQQHVENYLNQSLINLGMEYVDLYIYHMWDYHTPMEEIMEGLNHVVKAGKARYIGISNCFAWQLAKANYYARENGLTEFISIQGHYNLIAREEEREMAPFCASENIAMTPYSALASGRLSRHPTADADGKIIRRVEELAEKRGVSMTEISLAWLLTKVTSPVVGATKFIHVDGAVKSVDLELSDDEIGYLEELYVPHALAGVMAQNGKQKAGNVV